MSEYKLELEVRDYECDLQGIVNHANYLHYLEHTRHKYLLSRNIDFAALHEQGTDLIVSRIEIDYKASLQSRDKFEVQLVMRKEGNIRVIFDQKIIRPSDGKTIVVAKVTGVALVKGKPVMPENIFGLIS